MAFPICTNPNTSTADIRPTTPFQSAAPAPPAAAEQGATGQQRVANAQLGNVWSGISSGSSYATLFGNQSYVKNGSDPQLLSMLQTALSKAPELQSTALAQHVAMGKVGPEDIQILQSFLESKGYSVGGPGVDGKYGPLTHNALERFLNGLPPGGDQGNRSRSAAPHGPSSQAPHGPTSQTAPRAQNRSRETDVCEA